MDEEEDALTVRDHVRGRVLRLCAAVAGLWQAAGSELPQQRESRSRQRRQRATTVVLTEKRLSQCRLVASATTPPLYHAAAAGSFIARRVLARRERSALPWITRRAHPLAKPLRPTALIAPHRHQAACTGGPAAVLAPAAACYGQRRRNGRPASGSALCMA